MDTSELKERMRERIRELVRFNTPMVYRDLNRRVNLNRYAGLGKEIIREMELAGEVSFYGSGTKGEHRTISYLFPVLPETAQPNKVKAPLTATERYAKKLTLAGRLHAKSLLPRCGAVCGQYVCEREINHGNGWKHDKHRQGGFSWTDAAAKRLQEESTSTNGSF